ncbi:hypothetical protein BE15_33500 [Sorangium cellulosum]|uniref:Uncharacterized protein n=1 Tax=Sorangium cellulosum TaxID=56 RepID=A0A150R3R3_SORCE|nr:hypothetical protein BE15_33500 [Sorangium cellulosum]
MEVVLDQNISVLGIESVQKLPRDLFPLPSPEQFFRRGALILDLAPIERCQHLAAAVCVTDVIARLVDGDRDAVRGWVCPRVEPLVGLQAPQQRVLGHILGVSRRHTVAPGETSEELEAGGDARWLVHGKQHT